MTKAMAAGAYREMGQLEKAEQYLKEAYVKVASEYGENDSRMINILFRMGTLYLQFQPFDPEKAVDAFNRSLQIQITQYGEGHPETLQVRV